MSRTLAKIASGIGVVASFLGVMSAPAFAGHGGGGHVVVVTHVGGGGSSGPIQPRLNTASMPVEVIDTPPAAMSGRIKIEDVIAQHQLRVMAARVLLEPVKGRNRDLPAGTVLARVDAHDEQGAPKVIWCDLRPNTKIFWGGYDCLEEDQSQGKFTWRWIAWTQSYMLGEGNTYGTFMANLPSPVSYREATVAERPTLLMGYKLCDPAAVSGPPRFALAVAVPGDAWAAQPRACVWGVWPDAKNTSEVLVDRLHVNVTPFPETHELDVKVENTLPPGQVYGFQIGMPFMYAGESDSINRYQLDAIARQQRLSLQRKDPAVAPVVAANGVLTKGATWISVPVVHGLTGVTRNEARGQDGTPLIPVGAPVYGFPLVGSDGLTTIVWCAPKRATLGKPEEIGHFQSVCVFLRDDHAEWVQPENAMMSVGIVNMEGIPYHPLASPLTVDLQPIDLPPMTLTLTFNGYFGGFFFGPKRLLLGASLDWGDGPVSIRNAIYLPKDAGTEVKAFGGAFVFKPGKSDDEIIFEQTAPIPMNPGVSY